MSPGGKNSRRQITDSTFLIGAFIDPKRAMPRAATLSPAACATALHVQRRAKSSGQPSPAPSLRRSHARASSTDPKQPRPPAVRAPEQRRAEQKAFTDKLSTLRCGGPGVDGRWSLGPGESRGEGSGGIIKMKREPDRAAMGLPEPGARAQGGPVGRGSDSASESAASTLRHRRVPGTISTVLTVKYQQKRNFNGKEDDEMSVSVPGIFKMKATPGSVWLLRSCPPRSRN